MRFETFKAGHWQTRYQYKSFEPVPINHDWTWEDPRINVLLESANRALGELNAFSLIIPDVDLFIRMHIVKEAQTSSRIEGTQTSMNEALMPESHIAPEKRNDWREVQNYVAALNTAIGRLATLPLSNRLLRETHAILMQGVRGEQKQPGEFRVSQNWIGGSNLTDAVFIPPSHEGVPELMSDLEQFWHNEAIAVPHLVRIAISHYQFETIHPFLDGNGRIGRLLIPLYLVDRGLLAKPSLYISDFFERNRSSYYDALTLVRKNNDIGHWVRFFLNGVQETAARGSKVFQQVFALRSKADASVQTLGKRAANARAALEVFYHKPVIAAGDLERELRVSRSTTHLLIKELLRLGLLEEITGQTRDRLYSFSHYLSLFTGSAI
ncbi:MAG: Fic family protein [Zoogloeaceae bacterium]|jgi:Fic family protein|nr:Fic family protein [Zoogloeaceae bacterium]